MGSFWLVFLVEPPQSLPFPVAALIELIMYAAAVVGVLLYARNRTRHATRGMTFGLVVLAIGYLGFAVLPPLAIVVLVALAFSLYFPAFWLPMNVLLIRETTQANRAGRLAAVTATFTTVAIVAPAVGGLLASLIGFRLLFALAAVVVAADIFFVRRLAQRNDTIPFSLDFRRAGLRTSLAFAGQGAVEGLTGVATPLAAFLFTSQALDLGLLFSFFSLAAGISVWGLGRISDRVKRRGPFLLLGPLLSVPACIAAATSHDLGVFALSVGALSMTTSVAPSFIYTILVDRMEEAIPQITATRELLLNTSRAVAVAVGILLLVIAGSSGAIYALYFLVAGVVLLEAIAR